MGLIFNLMYSNYELIVFMLLQNECSRKNGHELGVCLDFHRTPETDSPNDSGLIEPRLRTTGMEQKKQIPAFTGGSFRRTVTLNLWISSGTWLVVLIAPTY